MPISELWNPQEYNPLAMQLATSMMGSRGGPGRGGAIRGAAEKILGAIMARGQQREYKSDLDDQIKEMLYGNKTLLQPGTQHSSNVMPSAEPSLVPPGPSREPASPLSQAIAGALGVNPQVPSESYGDAGVENTILPNFSEAPTATKQETVPAAGANKVAPVAETPEQVGEQGTVTRNVNGYQITSPAQMALPPGVEAIARAALKSNDPSVKKQASQMLIKHHAAKNPLTPDKRFMNLGDGRVFDVMTQQHIDSPWKPPKSISVPAGGKVIVPTPDGNVQFTNPKGVETELKQVLNREYYDKTGIPLYNYHAYDPQNQTWTDTGLVAKVSRARQDVADSDLTIGAKGYYQKKLYDSKEALDRVADIQNLFDDVGDWVQSGPGRIALGLGKFASDWKIPMPDSWKDKIVSGTEFQTHVRNNANLYIKMITGAQMSHQEAGRLLQAIPNPDDGPLEFRGKMMAVTDILKSSIDAYEDALYNAGPGLTSEQAHAEAQAAANMVVNANIDDQGGFINRDYLGNARAAALRSESGVDPDAPLSDEEYQRAVASLGGGSQ